MSSTEDETTLSVENLDPTTRAHIRAIVALFGDRYLDFDDVRARFPHAFRDIPDRTLARVREVVDLLGDSLRRNQRARIDRFALLYEELLGVDDIRKLQAAVVAMLETAADRVEEDGSKLDLWAEKLRMALAVKVDDRFWELSADASRAGIEKIVGNRQQHRADGKPIRYGVIGVAADLCFSVGALGISERSKANDTLRRAVNFVDDNPDQLRPGPFDVPWLR